MTENFLHIKRRKLEYEQKFDVEHWVENIKDITFPTRILDFTMEEANAIVEFYRATLSKQTPSKESKDVLSLLETRIDTCIKSILSKNSKCNGVFVRLGSRSPKDAPLFDGYGILACERFKSILKKTFLKIDYTKEQIYITQQEYYAFCISLHGALKVSNGKEAMDLLLNSERVFVDLLSSVEFPELFSGKIVIREWFNIPYELEFRCFVYNNHLNAISQYDYNIYLNYLQMNKEIIKSMISEFWESKVKSKLEHYKNYVIDFGITAKKQQIYVIELNPFNGSDSNGTGGSLFDWERDIKILQNGPLEMRINEKPEFLPINPDWERFVHLLREETKLEQKKEDTCQIN